MTLLKEIFQMNEVVEPLDPSMGIEDQLEALEQRVAAAKRGLGFANKLKNPAQKKKHMALVLTNLNKIRGSLSKVITQMAQFDKAEDAYDRGAGYPDDNLGPDKGHGRGYDANGRWEGPDAEGGM
jgi:phage shock protein A